MEISYLRLITRLKKQCFIRESVIIEDSANNITWTKILFSGLLVYIILLLFYVSTGRFYFMLMTSRTFTFPVLIQAAIL